MFHSPHNLWQQAKTNLQNLSRSPQTKQAQKLAHQAVQQLGKTVQEWQQQTEELWQSERVRHLRQDVRQTAYRLGQQASSMLAQVTTTIKTKAINWQTQLQRQSSTPGQAENDTTRLH
ncbi:hypothetical protein [Gloeomargarita sp.]